jgi:hypothetical protein
VIDASEDITAAVRLGADVVYDPVGGPSLSRTPRNQPEGRMNVIIGTGDIANFTNPAGQEHYGHRFYWVAI